MFTSYFVNFTENREHTVLLNELYNFAKYRQFSEVLQCRKKSIVINFENYNLSTRSTSVCYSTLRHSICSI